MSASQGLIDDQATSGGINLRVSAVDEQVVVAGRDLGGKRSRPETKQFRSWGHWGGSAQPNSQGK